MKKYSKPVVKACTLRMSSILTGSDPKIKGFGTGAEQLSNERNNFFDEEEAPAW